MILPFVSVLGLLLPTTVALSVTARAAGAAAEDFPKVWIGVRITPIPAPLGAHIGQQGVMVINVVKDSPADQAGIQQYDVIVDCAGHELKTPADLNAAVAAAEPGQPLRLTIVRKGARQELAVTPAKRPTDDEFKFELKYDEPPESSVDTAIKLYGKALRLGPGGRWFMQDLGDLWAPPDVLKGLEDLEDMDVRIFGPDWDKDLDVKILRKLDDVFEWEGAGDEGEKRIEIQIRVEDKEQTTIVRRDVDGKFHVTRIAPDGNETTTTYDDLDALRAKDLEAYKLYRAHADGAGAFVHVRPFGPRALKLRRDFQVNVQKRLQEALERAREARHKARQEYESAVDKMREATSQARVAVRARATGADSSSETVVVAVGDDGVIKITISKDGDTRRYEFKNKEEFRMAEPELYERLSELLP